MIQDAFNQIANLKTIFPDIHSVTIIQSNWIILKTPDLKIKEQTFNDAILLLEWCEQNLNKL